MLHFFTVATRKLAVFLGAFFTFALLVACSPQSPENVVSDYIKAVANNRVDEAIGYFALEDVKENDLTAAKEKFQMIVGTQYAHIQENDGLDSVSTALADMDGDNASVDASIKYKNGKMEMVPMTLLKESGKWKIKI
jgi:hypothetical protein